MATVRLSLDVKEDEVMARRNRWSVVVPPCVLIVIGLAFFIIVAGALSSGRQWTPMDRLAPLAAGAGRFEVYVEGVPLERALGNGDVAVRRNGGWAPIAASDVKVRVNRADQETRIPLIMAVALVCTGLGWIIGPIVVRELESDRRKRDATPAA